jgi:hypothetical protein
MPARLAEAAGVWYDEFSNLIDEELPVTGTLSGRATRWVDGLHADGATVLAGYEHPHFGRWAAITTRAVGEGRIGPAVRLMPTAVRPGRTNFSLSPRRIPDPGADEDAGGPCPSASSLLRSFGWGGAPISAVDCHASSCLNARPDSVPRYCSRARLLRNTWFSRLG